jgi:predicted nucleotidyltransferase
MVPEKLINDFVSRLRAATGTNLRSVILYGSAAAGDYVPDYSDVNLLCVLGDTSFASIRTLAATVEWWTKQKHRGPLLMSEEELRRSADVFSVEFLDMKQSYRVLWGEDVLKELAIPMRFHRAQVEYELREKTILLRQRLLMVAGDAAAKWELLLRSVPAFATLARHALIALGETGAASKREGVEKLAAKARLEVSAFLQLLDIRERKADRKTFDVDELFARYLKAMEGITAAVDHLLDEVGGG